MAILSAFALSGNCRGVKRLCRALSFLLGLLVCEQFTPAALAEISKEYQVKAVFLFNFTQFVQWPTNAFSATNAPLTIGVLGSNPFGEFLAETVRGEKANGHPIVIKQFDQAWDVKDCQVLFISRSETAKVKMILAKLKGQKLLTVSDIEDFAEDGGGVRFVTEHRKIHFRINLEVVKAADLMISSQLLRLAEIVTPEKD